MAERNLRPRQDRNYAEALSADDVIFEDAVDTDPQRLLEPWGSRAPTPRGRGNFTLRPAVLRNRLAAVQQEPVVQAAPAVPAVPVAAAIMPDNQPAALPPMLQGNYDVQCDEDGPNAMENAERKLKAVVWDRSDLSFFFGQAEIKMKSAGVKRNFTKMQVLTTILPKNVIDECKRILRKEESDFPNRDSYRQLKREILRIFGPSEEEGYERAIARVMSGKPSTLGRAIINDICPQ